MKTLTVPAARRPLVEPPEWMPARGPAAQHLRGRFATDCPNKSLEQRGDIPGMPWKRQTILFLEYHPKDLRTEMEQHESSEGHLGTVNLGQRRQRASAGRCLLCRPNGRGHLEPKGQTPKPCKPSKQTLKGNSPGTSPEHRTPRVDLNGPHSFTPSMPFLHHRLSTPCGPCP